MRGEMFDVQAAIDSALEGKSEKEKRREKRFQEEQKAKFPFPDPRRAYAERSIEIGTANNNPEQIAEGYFLLGKFDEALIHTEDPIRKSEIEKYVSAKQECGCPSKNKFLKDTINGVNYYHCLTCNSLCLGL